MTKRISMLIVLWLVFAFADYFYFPYFVRPFSWFLVCIILLILSARQVKIMIKDPGGLKMNSILAFFTSLVLFFLTFYNFNKIPNSIIEKIDWNISYNKRIQIVKSVLTEELRSNSDMHNGICRLPFGFPIISNGGNEIWIDENKKEGTKTIKFWISRGFFESPQTYFIFTNDDEIKRLYEVQIKAKPEYNWKIEDNWYRIMERD